MAGHQTAAQVISRNFEFIMATTEMFYHFTLDYFQLEHVMSSSQKLGHAQNCSTFMVDKGAADLLHFSEEHLSK